MIIDTKLTFDENCEAVCKRGHQRLFCLRKLSYFHVDRAIMKLFYCAFIESVLSFCMVTWFGNLSLKNRTALGQIVKWAGKLIGETQLSPEALYARQLQRLTGSILADRSHPLYGEFQILPSGRRYAVPRIKTKRYRSSFVPAAILWFNKQN